MTADFLTAAQTQEPSQSPVFPIVGIGASAGGLEPTTTLLRSLPADTGMAFVVVQHLDPHHVSALTSILAKTTLMPVRETIDGMAVQPNEVYVIPPATEMILEQGKLRLTPRVASRVPPMPIDSFLISLAAECGSHSVGIILSGTGTDGTRGLQAIKSEGGITFAQDSTATHQGMPQSAEKAGCVDFVLPPEGIATELLRRPTLSELSPPEPVPLSTIVESDNSSFDKILKLLSKTSRIDFLHYKVPTLRRRIERRMVLCRIETLKEYLDHLTADPLELNSLQQEVLIHVTSFFRDPETFEALETTVLPQLIANRPSETPLRIWVPGCSSGEEVYSIVICILEFFETQTVKFPIKVFATDISEQAIEKARAAVYPESITTDVSPERLQRFFKHNDAGYQIDKQIRDACVFAKQDVTQDPPFSQLDLISCRNVLIYLGPELQSQVFPVFHYALKPMGYLVLGSAESTGSFTELFTPVDKLRRCYQRANGSSRSAFHFGGARTYREGSLTTSTMTEATLRGHDIRDEADRVVLNRYAPSGVLVDEQWRVVQFRGHTGRFLEPSPGLPSYDLLQMARHGLLPDLRAALEAANTSGLPSRKENVQLDEIQIHLQVIPIAVPPSNRRHFVVLFEELPDLQVPPAPPKKLTTAEIETEHGQQLARLQQELAATKAYLQSVIQGKDVTNEELKAANEEVISSNEELQSTNEELETAKEELQSTNEEMETINEELVSRIRTITRLNDELINLITGVKIPIVIIGSDLRVRRFSSRASEVLNLLPGDIGRLVTDLTLRVNVTELRSLIMKVIDTLEVYEQEVTDLNGYWYSLSIRPFRTTDNRIDGVILYLTDINAIKQREREVTESRDFAQSIIQTLHESLLILDDKFRVIQANRVFYQTFQTSPALTEKQLVFSLNDGEWNTPELRLLLETMLVSGGELLDVRVSREFAKIGKRTMLLNARRLQHGSDVERSQFILLAIDDVTARDEALRSLRKTELLMNTMVEAAVNAIITINEQGIIQTFNQAAEAMFGYRTSDAIGKNVKILLPQPERDQHDGYLQNYLTTGKKHMIGIGRDVVGQRQDGTQFPLHLGISEIIVNEERLFTGLLIDLSERRKLERQVMDIATAEQLRIGHDLHDTTGQELTGLSCLAQSLSETLTTKKLPESKLALRLARELDSLLEHVRHIARGLTPVYVDAEGLMAALQNLARTNQERSQIPTEFLCHSRVPVHDAQTATQLFLVAREAVNNCVKHSQAKYIGITLEADATELILEVSDDGIGIDFGPKSEGIGLQIMTYRANAMNGSLKIETSETQGTRLICRVPLNQHNHPITEKHSQSPDLE